MAACGLGQFDDDLVGAHQAHFVVKTFGGTVGVALDARQRVEVRKDANLPGGGVFRQGEQRGHDWAYVVPRKGGDPCRRWGKLLDKPHQLWVSKDL